MDEYLFCQASTRCRLCKVAYALIPKQKLLPWLYEKTGRTEMRNSEVWFCPKCTTEYIAWGDHVINVGSDKLIISNVRWPNIQSSPKNTGEVLKSIGLDLPDSELRKCSTHPNAIKHEQELIDYRAKAKCGKALLFLIISTLRFYDHRVPDSNLKKTIIWDFDSMRSTFYRDLQISNSIDSAYRNYNDALFTLIYAVYSAHGFLKLLNYISSLMNKTPVPIDYLLLLKEHVARDKTSIQFYNIEEIQDEKGCNFQLELLAAGIRTRGIGAKLQEAKNNAAKNICERLNIKIPHHNDVSATRINITKSSNSTRSHDFLRLLREQLHLDEHLVSIVLLDATLIQYSDVEESEISSSNVLSTLGYYVLDFCLSLMSVRDISKGNHGNRLKKMRDLDFRTQVLGNIASDLFANDLSLLAGAKGISFSNVKTNAEFLQAIICAVYLSAIEKEPNPFKFTCKFIEERLLTRYRPNQKSSGIAIQQMIDALEKYKTTGYINYNFSIKTIDVIQQFFEKSNDLTGNHYFSLKQFKDFIEQYKKGDLIKAIISINDCFEQMVNESLIEELHSMKAIM